MPVLHGEIETMATCDPKNVERRILQARFLRHHKQSHAVAIIGRYKELFLEVSVEMRKK